MASRGMARALLMLAAAALSFAAGAATVTIRVDDGANEGFNDNTPATPVGGNTGTTLGQQRLQVFQRAAQVWGERLDSTVPILVAAKFDNLTCTATSGTLGSAGPSNFYFDFPEAPQAGTAYAAALADAIAGRDIEPGQPDIEATFNSRVNGSATCLGGSRFYLGLDHNPTDPNDPDLLNTVLHEIGHGLGFLAAVNSAGNSDIAVTSFPGGTTYYFTPFDGFLFSEANNNFILSLSTAQRRNSLTSNDLTFNATQVNGAQDALSAGVRVNGANRRVRIYAPSPYEGGSSTSHWDTSASPNLLMEPILEDDLRSGTKVDLTICAFADIGWPVAAGFGCPDFLADLRVAVAESADPITPGNNVVYTYTVTNNGEDRATNVTLDAVYSGAGASVVSVAPGQGVCNSLPCVLGTLEPAGSATVQVTVRGASAGTISGTASVLRDERDTVAANDSITETTTVGAGNRDPLAVDDSATVNEDAAAALLSVLANDSDPDGDTLGLTSVGLPDQGGSASVVGNQVRYQSAPGFNGSERFSYTVGDGNGGSATGTVTVTVNAVNDAPVALDDAITRPEDSIGVSIPVLANDSDFEGDSLTITAVTQGSAGGSVAIAPGATSISYSSPANFNGTDVFTYTVSDGNGGSATATVRVTLTAVNDNPVVAADAAAVDEDSGASLLDVLANDSDVDGNTLTIAAVGATSSGGAAVAASGNTRIQYTPAPGFNGTETFSYTASDGNGGTASATVTVTVRPVNDAPVAAADSFTVAEDSATTSFNVLANDTDPDAGDTRTVSAVGAAANGTTAVVAGGTGVTYRPNANFNGSDSFSYTLRDAAGATATATVTVTVTSVNDNPQAQADAFSVSEDSAATILDVLANDSFAPDSGETLTISGVGAPNQGGSAVRVSGDTRLQYTPAAGFTGTESFSYTISDGNGGSATATVTITVANVNDAPQAVADSFTVAEDSSTTSFSVLANDTDPDAGDTRTVSAVGAAANGTAAVATGGTGVTYRPNSNFNGTDSFSYTIRDAAGLSSTATVTVTVTPVNDAPAGVADSFTVAEDSAATSFNVLANDTDRDAGDTLTVSAVGAAANGTTSIVGGGTGVSYRPAANFNGSDSFSYTLRDAAGLTSTATVTVSVTPVNDNPQAQADAFGVTQDSSGNVLDVLANDSFAPDSGETLTISAVGAPSQGGSVTRISGNTRLQYSPAAGFTGTETFSYTLSDGNGGSATALVTITVGDVNDAPVAVADSFTLAEDAAVTSLNVLANDTDPDAGDTRTVSAAGAAANGSTAVAAGGSGVTYRPNANFSGTDSFSYTIRDAAGLTASATVTVTVTAVNDSPVAVADSFTLAEDSATTQFDVLANDSDVDAGDTRTVSAIGAAGNGVVAIAAGGSGVTYRPNANFSGTDSFSYTVRDAAGLTATATVTVTVTGANDAPLAVADSFSVAEDSAATTLNVLANDSDPDGGDTRTVSAVGAAANGTTALVAGGSGVTYRPNANFSGTDSFSYSIRDAAGLTSSATVTVTVSPANDAPVGVADSFTLAEDSAATTFNVLANDTDADSGDTRTVSAVGTAANGTTTVVTGGTGLSYRPSANFNGTDSFSYTLRDAAGATATATVTVTVTAVNDAPSAVADNFTVAEDSAATSFNVLANDADVDVGDSRTVSAVGTAANGTTAVVGGGTAVSYRPNAGFSGSDSFSYTIRDAAGLTATATVMVTVTGANDAPVAVADSFSLAEDSAATTLNVLANDSDPDAGDTRSVTAAGPASSGTVTVVAGGTAVSYRPNANFNGTDSFSYSIRDAAGLTASATVTVTVTAVNDAPVAVADSFTVAEDSAAGTFSVLANDTDVDTGDTRTVSAVGAAANGTATVVAGGTGVSYRPNPGFSGSDSFSYTIRDAVGLTATANVTVTVTAINDAPVGTADSFSVAEDSAATVLNVLANDSDPDAGDTRTVSAVGAAANGTTALVGGGTGLSYRPNANFSGTDSFSYTLRDAAGLTATATVTVTVTPVNDAPTAMADSFNVAEDSTATTLNVLANDSDPDAGDTRTVSLVGAAANGTTAVAGGGSGVSYRPNPGFNGSDSFSYTLRDAAGLTATATVTVTVSSVNDAPVAAADSFTVAEDSAATTLNVLANDTDPDAGDTRSVSAAGPAGSGVVTVIAGGTGISYRPNANFSGVDSFSYSIRDAAGLTSSARVTVTVTAVNDAPLAQADSASATTAAATTINVLANDNDPDAGDSLTVSTVTVPSRGGSASVVGNAVRYTSAAGFTGVETFSYTVRDAAGATATASVSVNVTASANRPPVAGDDSFQVDLGAANETLAVLANDDTGGDVGDSLRIESVSVTSEGGTVVIAVDQRSLRYTAPASAAGGTIETFSYRIRDQAGATDTALVQVRVGTSGGGGGGTPEPDVLYDGGGGGAASPWLLAMFGLLGLWRRRISC